MIENTIQPTTSNRFFLQAYGEEIPFEYGITVRDVLEIIEYRSGKKGSIQEVARNVTLPHSRVLNAVEGYNDERSSPYRFLPVLPIATPQPAGKCVNSLCCGLSTD